MLKEQALAIQDTGFRLPAGSESCRGWHLLQCDLEKGLRLPQMSGQGVIFELKMNLGRCKTLDPDDAEIKTWNTTIRRDIRPEL